LARIPSTVHSYLSATETLPGTEAAAYGAVQDGKGLVARWLGQRRLALLAADDPQARGLARELNQTRQELAALLLSADAARDARRLSDRKEQLEKELARRLPSSGKLIQASRPDA